MNEFQPGLKKGDFH